MKRKSVNPGADQVELSQISWIQCVFEIFSPPNGVSDYTASPALSKTRKGDLPSSIPHRHSDILPHKTCFYASIPAKKDGKTHRYWSIVKYRRLSASHTTQRTFFYLGQINDTQQAVWRKSLDVLNKATHLTEQICLFPEDRDITPEVLNGIKIKLPDVTLQHPRIFSDCWLVVHARGLTSLAVL